MDNFFNTGVNQPITPLNEQFEDLKDNYQQIFIEAAESIRAAVNKFKPENPCALCVIKDCKIEKKDVFTDYPAGCAYIEWQIQILAFVA